MQCTDRHKSRKDVEIQKLFEENLAQDVAIIVLLFIMIVLTFIVCVTMTSVRQNLEMKRKVWRELCEQMMFNVRENNKLMIIVQDIQNKYEKAVSEATIK